MPVPSPHSYRIVDGDYVAHVHSLPIAQPLREVAIAIHGDSGEVLTHGAPEAVRSAAEHARRTLTRLGRLREANALVVVSGRFSPTQLNAALRCRQQAARLLGLAQRGLLAPLPAPTRRIWSA
jgi:hypothetical protein